ESAAIQQRANLLLGGAERILPPEDLVGPVGPVDRVGDCPRRRGQVVEGGLQAAGDVGEPGCVRRQQPALARELRTGGIRRHVGARERGGERGGQRESQAKPHGRNSSLRPLDTLVRRKKRGRRLPPSSTKTWFGDQCETRASASRAGTGVD